MLWTWACSLYLGQLGARLRIGLCFGARIQFLDYGGLLGGGLLRFGAHGQLHPRLAFIVTFFVVAVLLHRVAHLHVLFVFRQQTLDVALIQDNS